ncbi:MAG: membrane protein insertase YidC, partial [Pseudomonadota bacterium]
LGVPLPAGTTQPGAAAPAASRDSALGEAARVEITTPEIRGSLSLRGARIDDVVLTQYRETVDPTSDNIVLLSPSGAPSPYYAEFGWVAEPGVNIELPNAQTDWILREGATLGPETPVVLTHNTGQLSFTRTIAVDENFLFTVTDEVINTGDQTVTLYPYGLVSRHGRPETINFFVLHEGMLGVMGEEGLVELDYEDVAEDGPFTYEAASGWLGITDKYWATALIPDTSSPFTARYNAANLRGVETFQADYLGAAVTIQPGGTGTKVGRVFAGAKEVSVIDSYEAQFGIDRFELMIDWGWFYFITKPLFYVIDFFFVMIGNFGVAILIVTVLIKLVFFPLANKSYRSLAGMKKVQPEMMKIRERFKDDKVKQQQAMMELYKKEKINPLSGCLPILIQIPVFFALYKVLFVTIEMRHAPFFGWVQDLSAPDPTSLFNLFGLLPFDVPGFLLIGIWPILMGITMFVQMRLNPPPPDPTQAMIFNWMPLLFTFLLATFPAGLVIYWTWNNFLSIIQQWVIMRRAGVDIEIWDNTLAVFGKGKNAPAAQKAKQEEETARIKEEAKAEARQTKKKKKGGGKPAEEPGE